MMSINTEEAFAHTRIMVLVNISYSGGVYRSVCRGFSTLGFIGLGDMGLPMAKNLFVNADYELVLYDINKSVAASEAFSSESGRSKARFSKDVKQVAQASSTIITMLPNNEAVRAVYYGEKGLLENLKPNTLIIDSSTIAPSLSQEVFRDAKNRGIDFIDAPVSGGKIQMLKYVY